MSIINQKYYNWSIQNGDYHPDYPEDKQITKTARLKRLKRSGLKLFFIVVIITIILTGSAFLIL